MDDFPVLNLYFIKYYYLPTPSEQWQQDKRIGTSHPVCIQSMEIPMAIYIYDKMLCTHLDTKQ